LGFQGFLNWFYLPNPSPFGGGMWFFTLLLIFYGVYPFLAVAFRQRAIAYAMVAAWIVVAFWLHHHVIYGHVLWLATCGFALGMLFARHPLRMGCGAAAAGVVAVTVAAAVANRAGVKGPNFLFLLGFFAFGILLWHELTLPAWVHRTLAPLRGCLLEIYLIHSALFVHPIGNLWADFAASLALVLTSAKGLEWVRVRGREWLVGRQSLQEAVSANGKS
jgi:surface polysaccharide O-acyltransferase-like enzyme